MPKYGFLVVEGPHDAELAYRLLSRQPYGFKRVQLESEVPEFLRVLIPREYPPNGDLMKRMATPLFLNGQTHSLAIYRAEGDSRLLEAVQINMEVLDTSQLSRVGILLDADSDKAVSAAARYAAIRSGMEKMGYALPAGAGSVTPSAPRIGAFVLPDNSSSGTLEDLLLDCAAIEYPALLASAANHVATVERDQTLDKDDLRDFLKPSGRNKALISSISSILRPGKAIQVSIQDNRWLKGVALATPRIKAVQDFLKAVFELE